MEGSFYIRGVCNNNNDLWDLFSFYYFVKDKASYSRNKACRLTRLSYKNDRLFEDINDEYSKIWI